MSASDQQRECGENSANIELFGFPTSPYTIKVAGCLGFKQLGYQFTGVNPITYREIAFTGFRQVPVLQIGDECREDSDNIARWLDESFSHRPLLPESNFQQEKVLAINDWINGSVIPCMFRLSVDWPSFAIGISNGWKLAAAVHRSAAIPWWCRCLWPVLVKKAGFVNRIVDTLDRKESLANAQQRLIAEFTEKLEEGPFLAGQSQPTLADVSLYPLIQFGQQLNLKGDAPWHTVREVQLWMDKVKPWFVQSPSLLQQKYA